MKTEVQTWTVGQLVAAAPHIELNPAYQRGPAWRDDKKALLIDSVFRSYDLPKIYLAKIGSAQSQKFEVIDGQQRVRAIFEFADNLFSVPSDSINGNSDSEYTNYKDLSEKAKESFNSFGLTVTILSDASPTFKRTLFERLQLGERLNSAELRNALPSSTPTDLRSFATTHSFFDNAGISNVRYKREDYLTHVFAYLHFSRKNLLKDIKAPSLRKYVLESQHGVDRADQKRIDAILTFLQAVVKCRQKTLRNKWSFVDAVIYCSHHGTEKLRPKAFAEVLGKIEDWRKEYSKRPEMLMETTCRVPNKRLLYQYIKAYQTGAALKESLDSRLQYLVATIIQ
ncbi:DUF262 domain-containing protein [Prosthecobacter sp. SYSU 5D2]|uniref:DUF262 domain-containing protein n=1 Tax=Prosthecobacter sp. SYSU 5D2 TaxID=3134134 RepID=UPI0031FEBBA2